MSKIFFNQTEILYLYLKNFRTFKINIYTFKTYDITNQVLLNYFQFSITSLFKGNTFIIKFILFCISC